MVIFIISEQELNIVTLYIEHYNTETEVWTMIKSRFEIFVSILLAIGNCNSIGFNLLGKNVERHVQSIKLLGSMEPPGYRRQYRDWVSEQHVPIPTEQASLLIKNSQAAKLQKQTKQQRTNQKNYRLSRYKNYFHEKWWNQNIELLEPC